MISEMKSISHSTITKPFFAYRKDWSRVGVATLEKIGRDWKKDWKKDWLKREAGDEEEQNSIGCPGKKFEVDADRRVSQGCGFR
jgi:hypothetical protein